MHARGVIVYIIISMLYTVIDIRMHWCIYIYIYTHMVLVQYG